jgi:C-terminal processing protease CtpA/Prc
VPFGIGYVRVRRFAGTAAEATLYAQQLQDTIRLADRDGLARWIVDLRGNSGGNMYPMLAGIGPLLGDGVHGYFLDADALATPFSYRAGTSAFADTPLHQVSAVYQLKETNPRVAVLTDGLVASSGEAIVVAFRGRTNTRSFGTPTCGLSTGNSTWFLSDTSRLVITTSIMADRTRRSYGDVITPDEMIVNSDDAVDRAIQWLMSPPRQD